MPLYDYSCECGQRLEVFVHSVAQRHNEQLCATCGKAMLRNIGSVSLGGAAVPASARGIPTSWQALRGAKPDGVGFWRGRVEAQMKIEEKYPELRPSTDPVLAHEGVFEGRPLRVSDLVKNGAIRPAGHAHVALTSTPTNIEEKR